MPAAFSLPRLPAGAAARAFSPATPPTSFAVVLGAVSVPPPPPRLAPLPLLLETRLRSFAEGAGFPDVDAGEVEFENVAVAEFAALVPFPVVMPTPPRLAPLPLLREARLRSFAEGAGFPDVDAGEVEFENVAEAEFAALVPFPVVMPTPPPFPVIMPTPPPFSGPLTELTTALEPVLDRAAPADGLRTNLMLLDASIEVDAFPAPPAAPVVIPSLLLADPIRDPGLICEFPTFRPNDNTPASAAREASIATRGRAVAALEKMVAAPTTTTPVRTEAARLPLRTTEVATPEAANTSFDLQRVAAANGDFDETAGEGTPTGAEADTSQPHDGAGTGAAWVPDQFEFVVHGALPVSTSELPLENLADVAGKTEALGEVQDAGARVADRLTLRLDDALGHWEVDMVRHAELLDLVLRGDAELHRMVADATPELRDRLAAEGLTLHRIEFMAPNAPRGETNRAVEAAHQGEAANSGGTTHQHASGNGRREEAPPPAPAKPRRPAIAGLIRGGLLNRAV
ncbi:MAG: hypothetical protein EXR71_17965 [Myxococcales bacterium]|nr:hypothetical protein [Myxococcales bacterium]